MRFVLVALAATLLISTLPAAAQDMLPTPARRADEGIGPFAKLVIRGVNVIEGNGGPMFGPVDIVIENNRITDVKIA